MKTIVVAQQKGGVGKTTLALNIALYFARNGANVAIADADAQGSLTASADLLEGLRLVSVQEVLNNRAEADLVVIDTSPRNDADLAKVLALADFVLIPVKPGYLDVLALKDTQAILQQAGIKKAGIILNMVQHRNAVTREVQELLQGFSIPLMTTQIFQRVAYTRSTMTNGVFGSDDVKAQAEIENLADEILDNL
ncbi:ParA family protein [Spirosoma agri]|uniref:ParA family protein n=1 Tax=Spirosoma agri TaxID=1987381 RepID=A0A6M0IRJ6_9BACT|nr:ParA family protein [Spirosoma agri]NEU70949.1 ParA family protein [Spirosoma agri]